MNDTASPFRMPISEGTLAAYRWAVAPYRGHLHRIARRAYRRRGMMWGYLASNLILSVAGVVAAGLVLGVLGRIGGPDPMPLAIESYFVLFVFGAFHLRARFEDRLLRKHVNRIPRWYLFTAKRLGLRANRRGQLVDAVRSGDALRAWRLIEEIPGGRGMVGPACRWMRASLFGGLWNALVFAQYWCWFVIFLSTYPGGPMAELGHIAFSLVLVFSVAMIVMILIGQVRLQRMGVLADPTSWAAQCVKCGYNLHGLRPARPADQPIIICPECGTAHGA